MMEEPFYVLTEGIGVGAFYFFGGIFFWFLIICLLTEQAERFGPDSYVRRIIVYPMIFSMTLIFAFLFADFIKAKFSGRPKIEFYTDGFCYFDVDQSNRYFAWANIQDIFYCSYPGRRSRGTCSDGELTPRSAPSFNRGLNGIKIHLKNCSEGKCSVFIDSMYMSGFSEYIRQNIKKYDASSVAPIDRACDVLSRRQ